jgi:hypothetical protein
MTKMYTLHRSISSKNDQTSSLSALVETLVMTDEEVDHYGEAEAEGSIAWLAREL